MATSGVQTCLGNMKAAKTIGILLLIFLPPVISMLVWFTNFYLNGSVSFLLKFIREHGLWNSLKNYIWGPFFFGSGKAYAIIGIYALWQLVLMRVLPGEAFYGPETKTGFTPVYKTNGRLSAFMTLVIFFLGGFVFRWFNPAGLYKEFGYVLGALNCIALALCLILFIKGHIFPGKSDHDKSGNIILDYYRGIELYPRILGWDVKQFANSRFSMMAWLLGFYCFAAYQYETYGVLTNSIIVSCLLLTVYIGQFYWWETGYFRTMDIQHDRAGFYLLWGVLVWVPAVYTSPAMFMATHPLELPWWLAAIILMFGIFFITSKNLANRQRLRVRETDGETTVWGKSPVCIRAMYRDKNGEQHENILLASGFWGVSRHFHYTGEILGAFCWSCTTGFAFFMPFLYVTYLSILLFHRAYRDDVRCAEKYKSYWEEYKHLVPYKIIPGVY